VLSKEEGIIPALEPSHALAFAMKLARKMKRQETIVVTLSGRGDKDVEVVADFLGVKI
jgi:tryptophan synthase beta chain